MITFGSSKRFLQIQHVSSSRILLRAVFPEAMLIERTAGSGGDKTGESHGKVPLVGRDLSANCIHFQLQRHYSSNDYIAVLICKRSKLEKTNGLHLGITIIILTPLL